MLLKISQLDPHVLQAADIIPISRVGLGDVCRVSEISVWSCCGGFLEQVPAEGPQASEAEGPPAAAAAEAAAVNQLSHRRGTQEMETATQPAFIATAGLRG